MSTSIRKKYIRSNKERNKIIQINEANAKKEKNYNCNTYINPKIVNREKYNDYNDNSKEKIIYNSRESKRRNNLSNIFNNSKLTHATNNMVNESNNENNHKNRRNLSQDFFKKNSKIDLSKTISVIFAHEIERIRINLLKYLINNDDMDAIFINAYKIIEDLIDEYNLSNNCHLDEEENKRIIQSKFQTLKKNIMHEYKQINNEIYNKYYLNSRESLNRISPLTNFKKHCINCKDVAIHKCKSPLYLIPNTNYIICKQTNEIYHKNCFECFCQYDGEIYISSYLSDNFKNQIIPLTYRNSLEDQMYRCSKCNHIVYYNNKNKVIKCIKCNNEEIDRSNDVFYSDIFFHKLKEEVNFALTMKRRTTPNKYCACGGIQYQAKFLDKYIMVCSQCKKCQYDIRYGRYKYKIYLFKNRRNENYTKMVYNPISDKEKNKEKKIIKIYKIGDIDKTTSSLNDINEESKYQRYKNMDSGKNKIPKLLKTVKTIHLQVMKDDKYKKTNYNRFIRNNRVNNNNSQYIKRDRSLNKNTFYDKSQNNSGEILRNKKDLIKKKAKLLLNSNGKNSPFIATTLVASRKERALRGNYLEKNDNSLDQINKLKFNKLLMNSLDQNSFKTLMENIDPDLVNDIKNELTHTLQFKKTLTNNNNGSKKVNLDPDVKFTRRYNFIHHQSTNNIYTNINSTFKSINRKKFIIPSNLNMNDYKILNLIGSGSFSNIYQVQNIKTKKKFAIKKIIVEGQLKLEKYKGDIELVQSINNGYFFDDINIVPIIQYYIKKLDLTAYALYELMPLAQNDWNNQILTEKKNFSEKELIKILKQLSKALCYMQNNKISHRDIKPSNVFIINDNYYIGDFNESIEVNGNSNMITEIKGTEAFLSPIMFEALVKNQKRVRHNLYKSDVYSLGLCFVFAMTRNLYVLQKIKEIKIDEKIKTLILGNKVDKKIEYSQEFINLIVKMLCWDEKYRMDFIELNEDLNKINI